MFPVSPTEVVLKPESVVENNFRKFLRKNGLTPETLDKAEALLEELRPESPLRHRLSRELEELRESTRA